MTENFALFYLVASPLGALVFNGYYGWVLMSRYGREVARGDAWRLATLHLLLFWLLVLFPVVLAYRGLERYFSRFDDRSTLMPIVLVVIYGLVSFGFQSVVMPWFRRFVVGKVPLEK